MKVKQLKINIVQSSGSAQAFREVRQVDSLALRHAFGSFGTGVTVVTTLAANKQLVGLTANSFSSVSLDPPILLWSLNANSPSLKAFDECGRFVVNVLAHDQVALSKRFASKHANKFEGISYRFNGYGLAVLNGCAAAFDCKTEQRLIVGDHVVFLGRVESFERQDNDGLLFCQGRYARGALLED